eukprot:GFYU01000441.1.p1 GENE.GFYU01000441.1~~GFYU01000441.1.p1  ORF type:complete len:266 (-),score=61.30 GFYU01000441.1:280-1077(-)
MASTESASPSSASQYVKWVLRRIPMKDEHKTRAQAVAVGAWESRHETLTWVYEVLLSTQNAMVKVSVLLVTMLGYTTSRMRTLEAQVESQEQRLLALESELAKTGYSVPDSGEYCGFVCIITWPFVRALSFVWESLWSIAMFPFSAVMALLSLSWNILAGLVSVVLSMVYLPIYALLFVPVNSVFYSVETFVQVALSVMIMGGIYVTLTMGTAHATLTPRTGRSTSRRSLPAGSVSSAPSTTDDSSASELTEGADDPDTTDPQLD